MAGHICSRLASWACTSHVVMEGQEGRAGGREGGTGCLDCVLVSPYRHSLVGSFCWLLEEGRVGRGRVPASPPPCLFCCWLALYVFQLLSVRCPSIFVSAKWRGRDTEKNVHASRQGGGRERGRDRSPHSCFTQSVRLFVGCWLGVCLCAEFTFSIGWLPVGSSEESASHSLECSEFDF